MLDRISIDPAVYHGEACIRRLRIPVYLIVELVAAGLSTPEILAHYPDLESEDIKAALEYAAFLAREKTIPFQVAV